MTDSFILLFYLVSFPFVFVKGVKVVFPLLFIFIYILIHSGFFLLYTYDKSVFFRAMHLLNFIFFVTFYHRLFFNKSLGENSLRVFALVSTLFLVIQQVARIQFGYEISGNLFPQYAIFEADQELMVNGTDVYRSSSFFSEPAAYAVYVICALAHELFYRKITDMKVVSFLCLGCILSTSNTAIACMAFLMIFYVYTNRLFRNRNILLLIIALIAIYFVATPHIEAINNRISEGRSYEGRFHGYSVMYSLVDNPIWGIGFVSPGDLGVYLAGFARLFVYLGMAGVALYCIVYANVFILTKKKILLLVFLFLNIGSDTFFSISFLYYSCFIFTDYYTRREKSIYHNNKLQ